MSLRDQLRARLAEFALPAEIGDDTSLIRSGLLDSSALFNLALWIEEQTGAPVDAMRVNFRTELDTVAGILQYVTTHQHGKRGP
jgi:acyl carrier protein